MAENILLFPSLTDDLLKKIRFQKTKYVFFYTDGDDQERELTDEPVEALSSIYCIKDESGEWDQDKNDFGLRRRYCLRTYQCLFGPTGIAGPLASPLFPAQGLQYWLLPCVKSFPRGVISAEILLHHPAPHPTPCSL